MDCDLEILSSKLESAISGGLPEEIRAALMELVFAAVVASATYWGAWDEQRRAEVMHLVEKAKVALKGSEFEDQADREMARIPQVIG